MFNSQNLLRGKSKYLFGLLLLSFISVICVAFSIGGNNDFDISRREVLLRQIGHEILLQSGDSTSLVRPIKKIAANEYQISFENPFTFQPGFLIKTTQHLLAKDPLASDYVVNVLNCANSSVTYGYAISKNKKDNIIACIGRSQPKARYVINIKFKSTNIAITKNGYFLGALLLAAFAGFIFLRSAKPKNTLPDSAPSGIFTLGSMSFDAEARKLMINKKTIGLTKTETRVLRIFASSPNEAIERSRLQKEIWEDDGVIVGRSLDMFISKLRKKLEPDPTLKIAVIRGKGYKLEIGC
jgi:hypothetical protein